MTTVTAYQVHPASPRLGAEIHGINLAYGVDETTAESLRQEFRTHKVLVFRHQHLTPDEHVEAVRIFDEPFDHPTAVHRHETNRLVYTYNLDKAGAAALWHVGGLWRTPPFSIESLIYEVVPEVGGRTLWADLQAAYDDLSQPFKDLLRSVSAVYDANAENYGGSGVRVPVVETVEHPVVRTHRHTGRKGLFISTGALRLTGLEAGESATVLSFLLAHASSCPTTPSASAGNQATWCSGTTSPPGTTRSTTTTGHVPTAKSSPHNQPKRAENHPDTP